MFAAAGIALGNLVTETFSSNTTWVAPAGVSMIQSASGKGAAGTPGGTNPDVSRTITAVRVVSSSSTPSSSNPGPPSYSVARGHLLSVESEVSGGGSGSSSSLTVTIYPDNSYNTTGSTISWSNAIAGTSSYSTTGIPSSGTMSYGSSGTGTINYTQKGSSYSATTGSSATGFGLTFPGGTGGAASTSTFNNITVVPNSSYSIVVPSGGSITISYIKP